MVRYSFTSATELREGKGGGVAVGRNCFGEEKTTCLMGEGKTYEGGASCFKVRSSGERKGELGLGEGKNKSPLSHLKGGKGGGKKNP